ncbi:MAG: M20/M25/M40 family metallo-hydrolase [bacterium]|nr:M20/M25/M40 family metallo-hydrolase [Planctomycetota bacterium]HIL52645.1 M20/M25/M40 family metallo-hydrolase [Planctomycetota bacterium]
MQTLSILAALWLVVGAQDSADSVHHHLVVDLEPSAHSLEVIDTIRLGPELQSAGTEFTLSSALAIRSSTPAVLRLGESDGLARYALSQPAVEGQLRLEYGGSFDYGLSDKAEEYTRGFRESRGVVSPEGVYLHGGSAWVPSFGDGLLSFECEVSAPADWHVISQGGGNSKVSEYTARWNSGGTLEQVYLVGGPLVRFEDRAGDVEALVYLHEDDAALAYKYLEATAQYLEMYRGLIGPYPYEKFAMVENFWETGYGMPSFCLLGPQVVRFPFILHSSYPHEILHNWWGNSVFVDYESGNWCEGLTAYMADHLISEQRGKGAEYRRTALQKYRDFVKQGRDFPLSEFRSRHSASTEAVGYGKSLMTFHMLRRRLGDEQFIAGAQRFFSDNKGRRASFDDFRLALEAVSGDDLAAFFEQWVEGLGAPFLVLSEVELETTDGGFALNFSIAQTQAEEPFDLAVPVRVTTVEGLLEVEVPVAGRLSECRVVCKAQPTGIEIDPLFDLFRVLEYTETPPSIGQIFGEERVLCVLPADASDAGALYRNLANEWQSAEHKIEFALDSELKQLPADRSIWIMGRENRFAPALFDSLQSASLNGEGLNLAGAAVPAENYSAVVIARHPMSVERALGFLSLEPTEALAGMARKLPHYGKYSYLAFEGNEPTNRVKGQWGAEGSPLVRRLSEEPLVPAGDSRVALAETPPVFSAGRLKGHVDWLASAEREGRGLGSAGLNASAHYIAKAFAEAGLEPGGDNHSWYQNFIVAAGPEGQPVAAKNVIGILRGKRADWQQQSIVLGAHYDHLGRGWPEPRVGEEGQIHPGADDNASGVSIVIELARQIVAAGGGSRTLVVVAFSAEECGLLGSRHYVSSPRFPLSGLRGMINLDTVGRLGEGKIKVHATSSADEWQHIFRGAGFVTGLDNLIVPDMIAGSDQESFIEAGVPAVQIFTGANLDYHRSSDTADKIVASDLVKVASFVREGVVYMLEREEPLTVRLAGAQATPAGARGSGRRVSFGSVPDFGFEGPGMRFDGILPDSPADRAGLRTGDILIRIDDTEIAGLREFSGVLKSLEAGQTVTATVLREGEEVQAEVTLVAR